MRKPTRFTDINAKMIDVIKSMIDGIDSSRPPTTSLLQGRSVVATLEAKDVLRFLEAELRNEEAANKRGEKDNEWRYFYEIELHNRAYVSVMTKLYSPCGDSGCICFGTIIARLCDGRYILYQ